MIQNQLLQPFAPPSLEAPLLVWESAEIQFSSSAPPFGESTLFSPFYGCQRFP
jgi:hypothetical protein